MRKMAQMVVKVPATAANLGAGFDCLGLALDIYDTVMVEESDSFAISISGEGEESISRETDNRVYQGLEAVYERMGKPVPKLKIHCRNEIPLARGLGSSAAAIAAGLVAGNTLCGEPLSPQGLLTLGASLEGHPDNIAPALCGGLCLALWDGEEVLWAQIPLPPGLKAVLFIPEFEMPTEKARSILPQEVNRGDAVFNISRAALLVLALTQDQPQYLRVATEDRLHQPYRRALFPAMDALFDAALSAGALGVFLSGGGSTVLALSRGDEDAIAQAMSDAAKRAGVEGKTRLAQPSLIGAQRIENETKLW
jgi:homoserine kinase